MKVLTPEGGPVVAGPKIRSAVLFEPWPFKDDTRPEVAGYINRQGVLRVTDAYSYVLNPNWDNVLVELDGGTYCCASLAGFRLYEKQVGWVS